MQADARRDCTVRLIPSDPDVETIVRRIDDRSLDLQPEFQRGSVWSRPKQQLLIDSILRQWYVPPIHVVRTSDENQVVLDGQQRLTAIYEFVRKGLRVDGFTDPSSSEIEPLHRLRYQELPDLERRRFDRFTVRVFEVVDYEPEEPWELFYRLNSPMPLTAAEKRNAFFGPAREQVAELTQFAVGIGMTRERLGFSNARLAYEDLLARFLWTVERGTLEEKVTASRVTDRYREPAGFSKRVVGVARTAVGLLLGCPSLDRPDVRLNRAMVHTWLCFIARAVAHDADLNPLDSFIADIEVGRHHVGGDDSSAADPQGANSRFLVLLNDRATSRVNDVSSVVVRDAILWTLWHRSFGSPFDALRTMGIAIERAEGGKRAESALLEAAGAAHWGELW